MKANHIMRTFCQWKGIAGLVVGLGLSCATDAYAQRSSFGGGGGRTGGTSGFGGGTTRSSGSSSRGTAGAYPRSGEVGQAMISVNQETRQIIVITDEETNQKISQVITNLDRVKPQVLIKVVFLEVTYGKSSDIGIDGSITKHLGSSTYGKAENNFNLAALGANALPLGAGGMYQVFGNDFQATLRAIQQAGKTEVLSRPSIMARNNQQAVIMVGQRVPIISASQTIALTGGVVNSITYENVGIILRVTPFISSDGLVEMIVAPEISSIANQGTTISTGTNAAFNAPVINSRSAETVVVTPDGKTVIIGGLMENSKTENIRKIPLLGDIPLLGALFRRKVKEDTKTELMIFLTPHIVAQPSLIAAMTTSERGNAVLAPQAFPDQELDRFLDALPVKSAPSAVVNPAPPAPAGKPATTYPGGPASK